MGAAMIKNKKTTGLELILAKFTEAGGGKGGRELEVKYTLLVKSLP